jgi:hypothetical protein
MTPKISIKKIILIGQKKVPQDFFLMFAKSFNNEQCHHTYFIGYF